MEHAFQKMSTYSIFIFLFFSDLNDNLQWMRQVHLWLSSSQVSNSVIYFLLHLMFFLANNRLLVGWLHRKQVAQRRCYWGGLALNLIVYTSKETLLLCIITYYGYLKGNISWPCSFEVRHQKTQLIFKQHVSLTISMKNITHILGWTQIVQ